MNRLLIKFSTAIVCAVFFIACGKADKTAEPPHQTFPAEKKWTVSTFAGSAQAGLKDGMGTQAQFDKPQCLTLDNKGNLFVGEVQNVSIRKVTTDGNVTTYAGRSIYEKPGEEFGNIYGIGVDNTGNLFIAESFSRIRKVQSPKNHSIFAGNLTSYYKDGNGPDARLRLAACMVLDAENNIYLPDFDNDEFLRIRKISPSADVTTLPIQDNTGYTDKGDANIHYLSAIARDKSGNMFFSCNGNCMIKKITSDGKVSIFAGNGGIGFKDGKGMEAEFFNINALATDKAGNVWVADASNQAIRMITPDGVVTTIAGLGPSEPGFTDGNKSSARFNYPSGITVTNDGIVYVADLINNCIRKIEYK